MSQKPHIFWECDRTAAPDVGNKMAVLGELHKDLGVPVPRGFGIPKSAFMAFLAHNHLEEEISRLAADMPEDYLGIKQEHEKISQCLALLDIPDPLRGIILEAARTISTKSGSLGPFVVRSSSSLEDRPETSFAGMYDSIQPVYGEEELLDAIKRCWSSAFNPRAVQYMRQFDIERQELHDIAIGVIVQEKIDPRLTGVLTTVNPITGDRSKAIIECSEPGCKAISLSLDETNPASMTVDFLTREVRYDDGLGYEDRMEPEIAIELSSIARRIQAHLGEHQYIEWAVHKEREFPHNIVILQSRPVTSVRRPLTRASAAPPLGSSLAHKLTIGGNRDEQKFESTLDHLRRETARLCRDDVDRIHLRRAEEMARLLMSSLGGNPRIVLPAIILHDIGWYTFAIEEERRSRGPTTVDQRPVRQHEIIGQEKAPKILEELGFSTDETEVIADIIGGHDTRMEALSLDDSIVKDADRLSRYTPECGAAFRLRFEMSEEAFREALITNVENWFFNERARILARMFLASGEIPAGEERLEASIRFKFAETLATLEDRILRATRQDIERSFQERIKEKLYDVKRQIEIYLESFDAVELSELQADEQFQAIAVQSVAGAGYTAIIDRAGGGQPIFHADPRIINMDIEEFKKERPPDLARGFWSWYERAIKGEEFASYYQSKDREDRIRNKFQYVLPLDDGQISWALVATVFVDEFFAPVEVLGREIGHTVRDISGDVETHVLDPILELVKGTERIGGGDFSGRVETSDEYELGFLAQKINEMTEKLIQAQQAADKKEQALRQAQKMETVGTLAGGLAHDFNNVMGGVIGTISLLQFKLRSEEQLERAYLNHHLKSLAKSSERASNMVQRLLSITRPQKLTLEAVDLCKVVDYVVKICGSSLDKSVEVYTSSPGMPALVEADVIQLEQVLLNLCVNGAHAMTLMRGKGEPWGGRLEITTKRIQESQRFASNWPDAKETDYWLMSVADSGVGIAVENRERVFDPFFTTKGKGEGTGLGLAMVYNIVVQHGGFVEIRAKAGGGTVFDVYLPALEAKETRKEEQTRAAIPRGSGVVLVVDDEEIVRDIARELLTECGYQVLQASHGEHGVKVFKEHHAEIDVVLLDMVMPKMAGDVAAQEILAFDPDAKVILCSGYRDDPRVIETMRKGVKRFVPKPYRIGELVSAIKEVMD